MDFINFAHKYTTKMAPFHLCPTVKWLETAGSTNNELRMMAEGADNLTFLATESQTEGRGQHSNKWYSVPGDSLTFSYLLKPSGSLALKASESLLITCATSLAVRDYLAGEGIKAAIKWPNDIWVDGKKICGILIENSVVDGYVVQSIVGVGLNLGGTSWPSDLPNPVSIEQLTGRRPCPHEALDSLSMQICRRWEEAFTTGGRLSLQEEFGKCVFMLNADKQSFPSDPAL